jgi:hypothetical protein
MVRKSGVVLEEVRRFHAQMMAVATGSPDERFERIFELVPREAFLGPVPGISPSTLGRSPIGIATLERRATIRCMLIRTCW